MKRLISIVLLLIPVSVYAITPRIIPSKDITYLGSFRLPDLSTPYRWQGGVDLGASNKGMGYDPTSNTLFAQASISGVSGRGGYSIVRIGIPTLKDMRATSYSNLNAGTIIEGPVDITASLADVSHPAVTWYSYLGDVEYLPAQGTQSTGKLYWSIYGGYTPANIWLAKDSSGNQLGGQFAWCENDLSDLNCKGTWRFLDRGSAYVGKYLFHAPQTWADAYTGGKSLITGYVRGGGGSGSGGVNMYAFAPWQSCQGSPTNCKTNPPPAAGYICPGRGCPSSSVPVGSVDPVPVNTLPYVTLLQYGPLNVPSTANMQPGTSAMDNYTDGAWLSVGSKRAIVFSAKQNFRTFAMTKTWNYGAPQPGNIGGYYNFFPPYPVLLFWDQDEITAVACGSQSPAPAACSQVTAKQPYQPLPYAKFELLPYFYTPSNYQRSLIGGMAYDETKNLLYVEECEDQSSPSYVNIHAIHVFKIADSGSLVPTTTPPSAPSLTRGTTTKTSVALSWTASKAADGLPVFYVLYRNDRAIWTGRELSWTDNYLNYYTSPVKYTVSAIDISGNTTVSNTIYIDEKNGGNVPMNLYIPSFGGMPSQHEVGTFPKINVNEFYSFCPSVDGGAPPYTWKLKGGLLPINSSTGCVSGTYTGSTGSVTAVLGVTDANGNSIYRTVGWFAVSGVTDKDGDGVTTATDPDDYNINTPTSSRQPAPTALVITDYTNTSISLSWTAAPDRTGMPVNGNTGNSWMGVSADLGYKLYWDTSPGSYSNSRFIGNRASYTLTGLNNNNTYYFTVTATDMYGSESVKSNEVRVTLGTPRPPGIRTFIASPSSITPGQSSMLSWVLTLGSPTSLTIDHGVGSVLGTSSVSVSPTTTTTYTLTATNGYGVATVSTTVTVGTVFKPAITSFTATPLSIINGNSSMLSWTLSGGSATSLTIDHGVDSVLGQNSIHVSPTSTTTYTLTASNSSGTVTSSVTVSLSQVSKPVINSFAATSASIVNGQSSALSWTLSGGTPASLSINQGVGSVLGLSSKDVTPVSTTTYILTASNAGRTATASTTVTITTGLNGYAYGAYYAEGMDEGNSVVQTADGNIVMASFSQSYAWASGPGTEVKRMLLIKANPKTGQEIWRRVAGPEGWNITTKQISPLHWAATRVIQSGTDLIVSGYRGTLGSERVNASLTRFDSSGNVVWDREFNGTGSGDDYLWDVVERSGGGFAAAGYGKRTSNTEGWLVLTNSDGLNATHHYYNVNGKGYEVLRCIRKTSDGGYIMVGWTQSGSSPDEDYYVVKVSSTGALEWANRYDHSGSRDKATSVEEDDSGNFWIFGRSQKLGVKNTKIWIVKVNSSGILQTSYTIGDDNTSHAYVSRGTIKLANGNFLIMGYTNVSTGSGYHGYVTEIDTKGQMVGSPVTIGAKTGYTEDYLFSGVVSTGGNDYYLAGTDNGAFSTAYDLWFLKLSTSDKSIQNFTSCPSKTTFYYDKDLDGHGNNNQWSPATGAACFAMPGYVLTHNDPDDSDPSVIPPQKVPPVLPNTPSTIKP